jgi:hypothetical protein
MPYSKSNDCICIALTAKAHFSQMQLRGRAQYGNVSMPIKSLQALEKILQEYRGIQTKVAIHMPGMCSEKHIDSTLTRVHDMFRSLALPQESLKQVSFHISPHPALHMCLNKGELLFVDNFPLKEQYVLRVFMEVHSIDKQKVRLGVWDKQSDQYVASYRYDPLAGTDTNLTLETDETEEGPRVLTSVEQLYATGHIAPVIDLSVNIHGLQITAAQSSCASLQDLLSFLKKNEHETLRPLYLNSVDMQINGSLFLARLAAETNNSQLKTEKARNT